MKLRIALLTILCVALAGIPAWADVGYDNGAINGNVDAWTINFGYVVSDSYVLASNTNITGFSIGVWEFPGDTTTSVDWAVGLTEYGNEIAHGTASVTDTFISTNGFGYNVDELTATGLNVPELANVTYWLSLQNAVVASGDPVFWDENSGKSQASESSVGTIPSEAFTINTSGGGGGGTTPEPSSIMLFGSGILGLAGVLRRKLF